MSIVASEDTGPQPVRRILFPPAILEAEYLGPLQEQDGKGYPRTFGCSSILGGIPVFLFGDVSVNLPGQEKPIGIATSAASIGSHLDPLITHWPYPKNSSAFHNVPDFIPFTDIENEHNAKSESEGKGRADRFYLWARSPIVEIPFSGNFGVIFFTKGKTSEDVRKGDEYHGVGVAEVEMRLIGKGKGKGKGRVEEGSFEVMPIARRHGNRIFDVWTSQSYYAGNSRGTVTNSKNLRTHTQSGGILPRLSKGGIFTCSGPIKINQAINISQVVQSFCAECLINTEPIFPLRIIRSGTARVLLLPQLNAKNPSKSRDYSR